jgi:hypothetical protein
VSLIRVASTSSRSSALPRRRLSLVVGHDGYLDAQKAAKAGRNERLLRLALDAEPQDAYLHYQLGKDLELGGRFAEATPAYQEALARCDLRAGWAPRPGAAHALHAEEARSLRGRDRPRRGRDAALAGFARLLFHSRRPCCSTGPRASRRAASSCCR